MGLIIKRNLQKAPNQGKKKVEGVLRSGLKNKVSVSRIKKVDKEAIARAELLLKKAKAQVRKNVQRSGEKISYIEFLHRTHELMSEWSKNSSKKPVVVKRKN